VAANEISNYFLKKLPIEPLRTKANAELTLFTQKSENLVLSTFANFQDSPDWGRETYEVQLYISRSEVVARCNGIFDGGILRCPLVS